MLRTLSAAVSLAVASTPAHASALAPYETIALPADAESVVIVDLDGDGANELAVATGWSTDATRRAKLHIYRHDPLSRRFVPAGSASFPDHYPNRVSAVAAELDDDGRGEVVVGAGNSLTAIEFDGVQFVSRSITTPVAMEVIQPLDLDGDGRDEIVGQSWSAGAALFRVVPGGSLQLVRQMPTGAAGWNDAAVGDMNRDGFKDWIVMSGQYYLAPHAEIFHSNGVGGFASPSNAFRVADGVNTNGIAAGDVNADGAEDLVLSRSGNAPTSLYVLTQQSGGRFGQVEVPTLDIPSDLAIVDLDGTGGRSVLVLHRGWGNLSIYSTSAAGLSLSEMVAVPYGDYGPTALATGDVDGDGCPDVAVAGRGPGLVVLRGQQCAPPPDTTPEPFEFAPMPHVVRGSVVTSGEITVAGINASAPISIRGGTYSIDGGDFTSAASTVLAGQRVRVRHVAAEQFSTSIRSELSIGGVSANFASTTEAMDTVPDPIGLVDQVGVATGTERVSAPVRVFGINAPASITVSDGSYRLNGGSFTTQAGVVQPGDQVEVRHTSASSALTATHTTLTIGGVTDVFTSTTGSVDTTPNAFAFIDVSGARRGRTVTSNTITASGINATIPVSVRGTTAVYSKNGGAFTSAPGTVRNGDRLRLRLTASSTADEVTVATLDLGGVSATWSVRSGQR
ncbi:hypothetical protein GCM10028794_24960 [Silanimonas algicola]